MDLEYLLEKIKRLEFHQGLLLKMLPHTKAAFYQLVIEKGLRERDLEAFNNICENLNIELEEQKAEGFVHFHPLFEKFTMNLHPHLRPEETIEACLLQGIYIPLMMELKKYTKE
ncbi:DUF1878 family protein [Bacillus sp. 03113]|uniref:DUF1878 family protein n=1 Tax=Bacillus sp. 03113 TaxID=2578211 RepID=UPI00114244C1|nr:DUF1878 family protein [Bacillus sp. 03113]